MEITNIIKIESSEDQVAYNITITIDNILQITGIQAVYTFADEGDLYSIKWPYTVNFVSNNALFSVEKQIMETLDTKKALIEYFKHKSDVLLS